MQHNKFPEKISIIVAVGKDGAIGRNNSLIWHLPGDLPRFKRLTTGRTVIMGRNTWQSLPHAPLPDRRNIVLSYNPDFKPSGAEVYSSLPAALAACADEREVFIIGGGKVYSEAFSFATNLYLTEVDADTPDADTFINLDFLHNFTIVKSEPGKSTGHSPSFRFVDYALDFCSQKK